MPDRPKCPNLDGCPMHGELTGGVGKFWVATYCRGKFERCERFKRFSAGQVVPVDLMPNGERLRRRGVAGSAAKSAKSAGHGGD